MQIDATNNGHERPDDLDMSQRERTERELLLSVLETVSLGLSNLDARLERFEMRELELLELLNKYRPLLDAAEKRFNRSPRWGRGSNDDG